MAIDFTPNFQPYSGQHSFWFWSQKVLPLVYDDSLSYYEVLCKVVTFLNNVIMDMDAVEANTEALRNAYNELQGYVNTYFDNLDVQNEINNKLDAMAESGELSNLIEPYITDERLAAIVDDKLGDVVAGQIDDVVEEQLPGVVTEQLPEEIGSQVTDWLTTNVDPVGSAVIVDNTLTISGAAADAKVTGDNITNLKMPYAKQYMEVTRDATGTYTITYPIYKGRTYTYTNNTSGSVNLNLVDSGGTSHQITPSLSSGNTKTFTADDNYPKFKTYMSQGGTTVLQSVDNGIFTSLNEINATATQAKNATDAIIPDLEVINKAVKLATNLANPENRISGSVWSGVNTVYESEGWCRQEIAVQENTTYTISSYTSNFSWFTDDSNTNLGHIESGVFTTPEGCTKIRLGSHSDNNFVVLKGEFPRPIVYENYPYGVYTTVLDNYTQIIDEFRQFTSVALFETIGAIGDSYTSGGIYDVTGVTGGNHYSISWPQIMARRNGIKATNYSTGGTDISHWLVNSDIGLPRLVTDTAKKLYVIFMGINTEKTLADPDVTAEVGTVEDINLTDPTQNADTFCGHYGTMISGILAHAPKAKIILIVPNISNATKRAAIVNVAELFDLPYFNFTDDSYFSSSFYRDNISTGHPIAITYSGMAIAFERQIEKCMVNYAEYFTNFS